MKLGVDDARRCSSTSRRLPLDRDRGDRRTAACASAPASATATSPPTRVVRERYPVLAAGPARRRVRASCATWPPSAATCCSAPAASTSRTSPSRATSASPAAAARPSRATHRNLAILGALRRTASPPTPPTWPSRWPRSTPSCTSTAPAATARSPLAELPPPARRRARSATPCSTPGELITAVELPPLPVAARSRYRKVRDRASYAFAWSRSPPRSTCDDGIVARRAGRARRRRPRAVAGQRAERALRGAPADRGGLRRRRRRRARRRRSRCATTPSRCRSRAT